MQYTLLKAILYQHLTSQTLTLLICYFYLTLFYNIIFPSSNAVLITYMENVIMGLNKEIPG